MTEAIKDIEVKCAHDAMVGLDQLRPNPKNPNMHPAKQIAALCKIIRLQGWRAPITVSNRSGLIVRGHGRFEAAIELDCGRVPVDYQDYASEAEEWSDLVADNKLAELSNIDEDLLLDLIQDIDSFDFDLELTGFDKLEIDGLLEKEKTFNTDPDDVPDVA